MKRVLLAPVPFALPAATATDADAQLSRRALASSAKVKALLVRQPFFEEDQR